MQGTHSLYFGGAYQFNQTFHEDGMLSAFVIIDQLCPQSARLKELRDQVDKMYKGSLWSINYVAIEFVLLPIWFVIFKFLVMLSNLLSAFKDFLGFSTHRVNGK